jgi:hypothetical protein
VGAFAKEFWTIQMQTDREIARQEEAEAQRMRDLHAKREAEGETKREIQRMRMRLAGLNFVDEERKAAAAPEPTNKEVAYKCDKLNIEAYKMVIKSLIGINSITFVSGELLVSNTFTGFDFVDILPDAEDLAELAAKHKLNS